MKMIIGALALAFAASPAMAQAPDYSPGQTVFEGWVTIGQNGFQLMASESSFRRGFTRPCISGALPRDEQRAAGATIGRQKVRITGTTLAWSDDFPGDRYEYEGSSIGNGCHADFIILATDIEVIGE